MTTYKGTVQRIDADGVFVLVGKLGGAHSYGPCAAVEFPVATPLAGNKVIVALLEGDPNRPVVIGRLATA